MAIAYGLKVILSVAVVAMVNHTAVASLSPESHSSSVEVSTVTDEACRPSNSSVEQQVCTYFSSNHLFIVNLKEI